MPTVCRQVFPLPKVVTSCAGTLSQQKAKAKVSKLHVQHAAPSTQQRTQQQQQQSMQQGSRAQGIGQQFKFAPNSMAGKYGGGMDETEGGGGAGHLPHIGVGGERCSCRRLLVSCATLILRCRRLLVPRRQPRRGGGVRSPLPSFCAFL